MDEVDLKKRWAFYRWLDSEDDRWALTLEIITHVFRHVPVGYRKNVEIVHRKATDEGLRASVGWKYTPPTYKAVEGTTPPEGTLSQLS